MACASAGAEVETIAGDARKRETAERDVAAAITRFGRLDVLVNNAQTSVPGVPLEQIDDATIALTLESGLLGTLYHMQAAFPHMQARGGSIINLGSREGVFGGVGFGIYAATKEGIRGLSRTAAREWGKHKIRVNVICPAALSPAAEDVSRDAPQGSGVLPVAGCARLFRRSAGRHRPCRRVPGQRGIPVCDGPDHQCRWRPDDALRGSKVSRCPAK